MARSASLDSTRTSSGAGTQNDVLRTVCAYWLDCIRSENVLEKDISLSVRKRAILAPLAVDPFIFPSTNIDDGVPAREFSEFANYAKDNRWDVFYGYPLLLYFDDAAQKHLVAPLFLVPVSFSRSDGALRLIAEDAAPSCGTQAFGRLGLRTEEIADISQRVRDIWGDPQRPMGRELADKLLAMVGEETPDVAFSLSLEPQTETPGVIVWDEPDLSPLALKFIEALHDHGWIIAFDWVRWRLGPRLNEHPELIAKARLETLRRLLTAHVRADRFVYGHLLATFETGGFTAILRRLQRLHDVRGGH